ncbi:hypothetical protein CDD81_1867 [Ophiocordyceps australis]|uniref:Inositol polyphosphate-related phosphatase domain-containing protein n=1 Tax=Ophiocordyceps australis TaxID=1399860 RepID=A0A2C5XZB4_9HYPO|nr:hypothetical protein CDD81_1867 [Ophiocordyceps australis]
MDLPPGDGPDGSSIKPVSSLLARFENLKQTSSAAPQEPHSPRPISPAVKPERLRSLKQSQDAAPICPRSPSRPADRATGDLQQDRDAPPPPVPLTRPMKPANKPAALSVPPAVTVQPPLSPPKGRVSNLSSGLHSPFLDPNVAAATHENQTGSPKPKRPAGRPLTPAVPITSPKSPRSSFRAPSPPPPRRSGETRRDREPRQALAPPPPRTDKSGAARLPSSPIPRLPGTNISHETSPFSSPPSTPRDEEGETPPELPTRPRPRMHSDGGSTQNTKGLDSTSSHQAPGFRRMEWEAAANGSVRGNMTPQRTGSDLSSQAKTMHEVVVPPAKLPRSTKQNNGANAAAAPWQAPATRSVTQAAIRHIPPPPTRQLVNARQRDKTPERGPPEIGSATSPQPLASRTSFSMQGGEAGAAKTDASHVTAFPDSANANRRPPFIKKGCHEIQTRYDARIFDVCGELVCTSGQLTRVWNLVDGEQIMSLAHTEGVKATAVAFKPAASADKEGTVLWVGTNLGDIMEVEVGSQRILQSRGGVHARCDVVNIYRHLNELWTYDEGGVIHVWGPDSEGVPNLASHPHQSFKLPRGHTFSMVVGDELWHATGKTIRVFAPTADGSRPFQVLVRPLVAEGASDVTAGTQIKTDASKAFFGHVDGKVSIFSTSDYSCVAVLSVSAWKINALTGMGQYMWAGYNTGKMCVYDMSQQPWVVKKEWQAHDQAVIKMKTDLASAYRLDRLQVVSLGGDNKVKAWDGLLQDDWLEEDIKSKDTSYCDFDEIKTLVLTWNAGASTPHSLRYSGADASFFKDLVQSSDSPDILIFGFQELVDLEDKKATAKRFLKSSKKKEGADQERMSHQYRDWRDFLMKTLDDYLPSNDLYHLLHSAPLVGLFTCVFVKSSLRERIRNLSAAEVKRGMGGLHGNKGAVVVRFQVDDTSLCFVNCHLAAGQSQASARHNDIAAILDTTLFPAERHAEVRIDSYTGGGDGSMIVDHELCILNGDLNYRIDTMSRDTVVKAVQQQNLGKLLERDQLLVARRRNPAFRLRAFEEMPITFAPTYKYDVGTDNYDTSEKRRSPAWCDRLLFRGQGRVQQLDYRRHEVRVSDHRPVTGNFRLWVKRIDARRRAVAWMESQQGFEDVRQREVDNEKVQYLVHVCGYDLESSQQFVKEEASRKTDAGRSRSRSVY